MGYKRTDEAVQLSLPVRRDYQLRSCSLKAEKSLEFSSSQLLAKAFQNARAISFNASHDEVPFVLAPKQRAFHSGPLTSEALVMDHHPIRTAGNNVAARHERTSSDSASTANSPDDDDDDDLWENSQEPERHRSKNNFDNSGSRKVPHFERKQVTRAGVPGLTSYVVAPRQVVSGDQKTSRSSAENRVGRNGEHMRASSRTLTDNRSRSSEILRGSRSNVDSRGRNTELMLMSLAGKPNPLKLHPPSVAQVSDAPKLRAGESIRRPTASIAWESLNKAQEDSPQHEHASIPFKWEEAPGTPITIADAAERAMARRFLKDQGRDLQPRTSTSTRKSISALPETQGSEATPSPAKEETSGHALQTSPNSSFRGSHRFYARTAPGERSFGHRKSMDGTTHVISEVETEAHIDLVAPAAAKFLVESCVSPSVTPEPNLTTSIPFLWEAVPGIPKEDAVEINKPVQLQLPPRLVAPPPADFISKEEMRGRQRTRSMSGPLAGYYAHTSPSRRRQQQHSPPVRRSCSPSKRSISPSKIQALFSRKASSPSTQADNSSTSSRSYRHSYTCGQNSGPLGQNSGPLNSGPLGQSSGPLDDFSCRAGGSTRALGRSVSGTLAMPDEQEHIQRSFASGPLDYGAKPAKRFSSPSKRSISPSRIQALAKQLTFKMKPSTAEVATLEDPNWPVSIKQVLRQHSFTSSVSLDRSNANVRAAAAATGGYREEKLERDPWSPTSILQGPSHPSGPSSASDMDSQTTQATTPVSVSLSKSLSKSLSRVSYESFEHSFTEPVSPGGQAEDAGTPPSPLGSPYLGPTADDYRALKEPSGGAADGVKALIKMCRSGSTWRKSRTNTPEMWAPTLASYFQGLEATVNPQAAAAITHGEQDYTSDGGHEGVSQTRLPYTMPSSDLKGGSGDKEVYCDSPNAAEFTTCLGVKLSPARFVSREENLASVMAWSERHLSHSVPTNCLEDGYRSPAYAATLELLSPSAELISKKKKSSMGSSRAVKLVLPSASMRKRTQFVEAMCKSLKRALYKCAKRCCRKTKNLQYNEEHVLPPTEFSFYKPN